MTKKGAVLLRFEDYDEAVLDEDALLVAARPQDRSRARQAQGVRMRSCWRS